MFCRATILTVCLLQLLIVLAIPAAALGIPFILSHPIICIALPLLVVYTPGLRAIAAPLAAQLLQLILSGLRPSGSPRSDTFPWQQVRDPSEMLGMEPHPWTSMQCAVHLQANANAWSSPPIDVDYRALPQIRHEQSQPGAASSDRDTEQQQWQDQSDIGSNSTRHRQQQELYRPDLLRSTRGGTFKQEQEVSQRPTSAVRSRLRTKVNIRPADKANMGSSRMVRQAQPGQVGVNLNTDAVQETRSNLVRALLVVFPFLRDWGGFL